MLKKVRVVMLPTNEKAIEGMLALYQDQLHILSRKIHGNKIFDAGIESSIYQGLQPVHQYFLSDEEIKEGDWYIYNKKIIKSDDNSLIKTKDGANENVLKFCKKIIATTDNKISINLGLEKWIAPTNSNFHQVYTRLCPFPQPSQSFLEVFVREYNKGNVIEEVMVEYMTWACDENDDNITTFESMIYVNPKDNTITIKRVKDSWNREEVIKLLKSLYVEFASYPTMNLDLRDNWIEENL